MLDHMYKHSAHQTIQSLRIILNKLEGKKKIAQDATDFEKNKGDPEYLIMGVRTTYNHKHRARDYERQANVINKAIQEIEQFGK